MRRKEIFLDHLSSLLVRIRSNYLLRNPELLAKVGMKFPWLKERVVALMQGRIRNATESAVDSEIKRLLQNCTLKEILKISKSEVGTPLGEELSALGFRSDRYIGSSDFSFGFYKSITEAGSIVKVLESEENPRLLFNEVAFDKYQVRFFVERLLDFATGYGEGIKKIFAHEREARSHSTFYLCLDDGAVDNFVEFQEEHSIYAFSRRREDLQYGLVPDPYIVKDLRTDRLPQRYPDEESAKSDFSQRIEKIFWRGATTGSSQGNDIYSNRRIAFCIDTLKFPERVDAKLTTVYGNFSSFRIKRQLQRMGVIAPPVSEAEFGKYTAYVDLEGFTSAWGTFRKYLLCIHVFKPEPQFSHFLDFFLESGSNTRFQSISELTEQPINDFDVAYKGYLSTVKAIELIKSGDATIFPVIRQKR